MSCSFSSFRRRYGGAAAPPQNTTFRNCFSLTVILLLLAVATPLLLANPVSAAHDDGFPVDEGHSGMLCKLELASGFAQCVGFRQLLEWSPKLSLIPLAFVPCLERASPPDFGKSCSNDRDLQLDECGSELVCVGGFCGWCTANSQCLTDFECSASPASPLNAKGTCSRVSLFGSWRPLEDTVTVVCIFLGSALAAGGGLGGGGMFVPLYLMLAGLSPQEAVPMSQVTIMGGSVANLINYCPRQHPRIRGRPLIDYHALAMFTPMLLAGTTAGVILNQVLPNWLILGLLTVMLVLMTIRSTSKAMQKWKQESQQLSVRASRNSSSSRRDRRPTPAERSGLLGSGTPVATEDIVPSSADTAEELSCKPRRGLSRDGSAATASPAADADGMVAIELTELPPASAATAEAVINSHAADSTIPGGTSEAGGGNATEGQGRQHNSSSSFPSSEAAAEGGGFGLRFSRNSNSRGPAIRPVVKVEAEGHRTPTMVDESGLRAAGREDPSEMELRLDRLEALLAEQNRSKPPLIWIILVWVLFLVTSLLRGGRAGYASVAGLYKCDSGFWALTWGVVPLLLGVCWVYGRRMRDTVAQLAALGWVPAPGEIRWTAKNTQAYPWLAAVAGCLGGMLGIGGGMIISPMLLELGMEPRAASATSASTVFLTASAAAVQYLVMGQLIFDWAAFYLLIGFIATVCGLVIIGHYVVDRLQRSSPIVFSVALVIALATVMSFTSGVRGVIDDADKGRSFGFNDFCE